MSLRGLCAVVYVWMLEELRRDVDTAVLAAVLGRAMGADVEVPDWRAVRAEFDVRLAAEPTPVDDRREVIMRAYGMRG